MVNKIEITTLTVTEFSQNCRIVSCAGSNEAAVVDPGGEGARILAELRSRNLHCRQIWLTHSHLDHCGGVLSLKESTGALVYAHPAEQFFRERVLEIARFYGIEASTMHNCPEPDVELLGGESLKLGGLEFQVVFTPGHSPGHVCFYEVGSGSLFCGDVLFAGSIGRTDLPGGDPKVLLDSIRSKLLVLPEDTSVYSGHGPVTQIGVEKRTNPFLSNEQQEQVK